MNVSSFIRGTTSVTLATVLSVVLIFVTQIILARLLSPSEFGNFITIVSIVTVFSTFSIFGSDLSLLKKFGVSAKDGNSSGKSVVEFSLIFTFFSISIMLIFVFLSVPDKILYYIILIPCVISYSLWSISNVVYQVERSYNNLAMMQVAQPGLRFLSIVILCFSASKSANNVAIYSYMLYSFCGALIIFISMNNVRKLYSGRVLDQDNTVILNYTKLDVLREAWPYGVVAIIHSIYVQVGLFLINKNVGAYESAIFGISISVLMAIYIVPGVVFQKLILPKFHYWSNHDRAQLKKAFQAGSGIMLAMGVAISALLWLVAPSLINIFFGSEYQTAANALRVLCFAIPFRFLISNCGALLSTKEHVRIKIVAMTVSLLLSVTMAIIVTKVLSYEYYMIPLSFVTSEIILFMLFMSFINRRVLKKEAWKNWFNFKGFVK